MLINEQIIQWSNYVVNNDGKNFAQIGISIENINNSLEFSASNQAILDIGIWFKSTKKIKSSQHILKINNEVKKIKNIECKENENCLLYFENLKIDRDIQDQNLSFTIELSNVEGFNLPFRFMTNKYKKGNNFFDIIIVGLQQYAIKFYKKDLFNEISNYLEILELSKTKYFDRDLYLYNSEFINNIDCQIEGYKLIRVYNDKINFSFNLEEEKSTPIIINQNIDIFLEHKPNIYNITLNANGGNFENLAEIYVTNSEELMFLTPIRKNYTFDGWSYSSSDLSKSINISQINYINDITLYAKWKKNSIVIEYKNSKEDEEVIFNNINFTEEIKYNESNLITITNSIPTANKKYIFKCWSDEKGKTFFPKEQINFQPLQLYAVWEEPIYKVTYVESHSGNILGTIKFKYNMGVVGEGLSNSPYFQWSYIQNDVYIDNNLQNGKTLPNTDIILYSVLETDISMEYYDDDGSEIKLLNTTIKQYNNSEFIYNYKIKTPLEYARTKNNNLEYFQYWENIENSDIYFSSRTYNIPILENNIVKMRAVYGPSSNIEHNVIINKEDNDIVLIAENFYEDNNEWKIIKDNKIIGTLFLSYNNNNLSINSSDFIEKNDSKATIDILHGVVAFGKFKQETLDKQYLELSLGYKENGEPKYVLFTDNNTDIDDDDIKLSLV